MIGKVLVGAIGAAVSLGLAAPAGASPVPHPQAVPDFLGAVRAAGFLNTISNGSTATVAIISTL